jgi:hypothetical protein
VIYPIVNLQVPQFQPGPAFAFFKKFLSGEPF